MTQCERMIQEGRFKPQEPKEILKLGYDEILENKAPIIGIFGQSPIHVLDNLLIIVLILLFFSIFTYQSSHEIIMCKL